MKSSTVSSKSRDKKKSRSSDKKSSSKTSDHSDRKDKKSSKKSSSTTKSPEPTSLLTETSFHTEYRKIMAALHAKGEIKPDDFQLLETVGTGTFGRVFLVRHNHSQNYFAMKILRKHDIVRLKQVDHIKNEREILGSLQHPFIVTSYAAFQDKQNLYMLLEYVVGGEIFSHLRRAGKFTPEMSRYYAAEIILVLEYMHSKNVIYRDLKPENLLLDAQGHVKVTDFGFAKRVEDRTWTLCGTPEYLAPEIIQSQGHDKAVDWWALGSRLYEMMAGYPPFFDDNPFGIYEKILSGRLTYPSHFDRHAQDLIKKLLTPNKASRLGNLRGGADDVKKHRWFKGVDWTRLLNREFTPPIIPKVSGPADTQNFEEYDEEWDLTPPPSEVSGEIFKDFVDYQSVSDVPV